MRARVTRREMLARTSSGFGTVALSGLLGEKARSTPPCLVRAFILSWRFIQPPALGSGLVARCSGVSFSEPAAAACARARLGVSRSGIAAPSAPTVTINRAVQVPRGVVPREVAAVAAGSGNPQESL